MLRTGLCALLALGLSVELGVLAAVASHLGVDYFDAYEYLGNARVLAEGEASGLEYLWRRPPLVPVLRAAAYPGAGGVEGALLAMTRGHAIAWGLSLAALLALGWHLRARHGALLALTGVALVAANPMFLHLVPFGLVDVPAMALTVLALEAALRLRAGTRWSGWGLALALAGAALCKYNLLLLGVVLVGFFALHAAPRRARPAWALAGAGAAWLGVQLTVQARVGALDPLALPRMLVGEVEVVSAVVWDDPAIEYLQEIFQTSSWLALACAGLGLAVALRSRDDADRLHGLWLAAFLAVMSGLVGSKSSRYLLPALPSLVHLQLRGLSVGTAWCEERLRSWRPALAGSAVFRGVAIAVLGAGLLALPVRQARDELRHLQDPVYRSSLPADLARHLAPAADRPIFWDGAFHALVPEEPLFFPHDETFRVHHFGPSSLAALLGRRISRWPEGMPTDAPSLTGRIAAPAVRVEGPARLYLPQSGAEPPGPLVVEWIEPTPEGVAIERRAFPP